MKAIVLDAPGEPNTLHLDEVPRPKLTSDGQLLVQVSACGLNPVDYKVAAGGHPDWVYPFILGLDVCGVVTESRSSAFKEGDRVYFHADLRKPGGLAEYVVIHAATVALKPLCLTDIQAAALPCAGFTAYQAVITKADVQPRHAVLVTGGAGGVGNFAIQLAHMRGASPIITTASSDASYLKKLGATHVINYKTEDVPARVLELTNGRGVDVCVDLVSTESAAELVKRGAVAVNGCISPITAANGLEDRAPEDSSDAVTGPAAGLGAVLFARQISVHYIGLGMAAYQHGDPQAATQLGDVAKAMGALYDTNKLSADALNIESVALEDAPHALERVKGRHVRGKLVVRVRDE